MYTYTSRLRKTVKSVIDQFKIGRSNNIIPTHKHNRFTWRKQINSSIRIAREKRPAVHVHGKQSKKKSQNPLTLRPHSHMPCTFTRNDYVVNYYLTKLKRTKTRCSICDVTSIEHESGDLIAHGRTEERTNRKTKTKITNNDGAVRIEAKTRKLSININKA